MTLGDHQRTIVREVASALLEALDRVSRRARAGLGLSPTDPTQLLAVNTNLYVHGPTGTIRRFNEGVSVTREQLLRLVREPFIARVSVSWDNEESKSETLYF